MVEARRVGDRAVLFVEDRGIGIQPDMLADINERLATPPMVDVAVSRMMGLVVVARLAARHGVKVELRASTERGIIADVTLPTSVLVPRALAGRAGAVSREPTAIESRQAAPASRAPFAPPLALESANSRYEYDHPTNPPGTLPPASAPPLHHPTPSRTPGGMPAWSDLTGAGAGTTAAMNGGELPRRSWDSDSFYGSQIPRQPTGDRRDFASQPPAGSVPISAVPVSAVPVSTPPDIPAPAAPPVWPPVADEPRYHNPASPVVPQHLPYGDETMELPIFRELESAWFSTRRSVVDPAETSTPAYGESDLTITAQFGSVSYGEPDTSRDEMVTAGRAGRMGQGDIPAPYRPTWQTAADAGWAAASAASATMDSFDTTEVGLPKRTPMAQLVPGGVDRAETNTQRRSPEGVRGLLSAYHRGVQRGRTQQQDDDDDPDSAEFGGPTGKEHEA
jgi:hypothetical protein